METKATNQARSPGRRPLPKATFGSGCFWCTEAVFQQVEGVQSVVSGYSGGKTGAPSYKDVCSGTTGHAEVIQIDYDPDVITYGELLEVFWTSHDPTTPDRQGNDIGKQYRSVIFFHSDEQRAIAERSKREVDGSGAFDRPVVTTIEPFREFHPAESYHQNYYRTNARQPYCSLVIRPRLEKLERVLDEKQKTLPSSQERSGHSDAF